jgi:signal transduction histidine kinase
MAATDPQTKPAPRPTPRPRLLPPHERTEDLLWWIVEATSGLVGDEFFNSLVSHLAVALKLKYVFITECLDEPATRVRTLARWSGNGLAPNIEYALAGQPCDETIQGREVCFYPQGVNQIFAPKRGTDRVSYYGLPILDSAGRRVIGHLAFFDDKEMQAAVFESPLYHLFASRAAAELQRKHAEEQSLRRLRLLAHAGRVGAVGEMSSAIAHEVNQPLTAITSYAQAALRLLQGDLRTPVGAIEALRGIAAQASRAAAVTQRLRGFLRNSTPLRELADLNEIAQSAAALLQVEARDRGADLVLEPGAAPLCAWLDVLQAEQVVINLVRNALDALAGAQEGARPATPTVTVTVTGAGAEVRIEVRDNGPGVPPALAAQIFDAFYTTKPQGMGIGLALSRTIAEAAGGTLTLDPAHAPGARFVFCLPAAQESAGANTAAASPVTEESAT